MTWREEVLSDDVRCRQRVRVSNLRQNVTSIYALCHPTTGDVRYVGKTVFLPTRRLTMHLTLARQKPSHLPSMRWLRKLLASGLRPQLAVLEVVAEGHDWAAREKYWIEKYRGNGARLLNLTDGGEGLAGRVVPQSVRARIAAAVRRGKHFACEVCATTFWRKPRDIEAGDNRFCSRACYHEYQRGRSKPVSTTCKERGIAAAAAARRAQTQCKRGHPLHGENMFITSNGSRGCKECRRLHKRTYLGKLNGAVAN